MSHLTNRKLQEHIIHYGKHFGLKYHSNDKRIKNPNNIKSDEFVNLLDSMGYKNINIIPPKTPGKNSSSVYNAYEFNDGNKNRSIILADDRAGRGTNQTTKQELSFLLLLSSFQFNSDESELLMNTKKEQVYKKIYDGDKFLSKDKVNKLIEFLNQDNGWYESILDQVKSISNRITNKPLYYVKDYNNFKLNMIAKDLFYQEIDGIEWNSDKWNPSDVWLIYEENIPRFSDLSDLNLYLYKSIINNNGIIGLSLKKGNGKIEEVNFTETKLNISSFKLRFGRFFTQNLYTVYGGENLNGTSITYRIFNANPNEIIRGESEQKKSDAAHGKVYVNYLNYLDNNNDVIDNLKLVSGKDTFELVDNKWILSNKGIERFKVVRESYKNIKSSNIVEKMSNDFDVLLDMNEFINVVNDYMKLNNKLGKFDLDKKISARFQSIILGSYFCQLDSDKLFHISENMLLYARSMTSWSSPHLK